MANQQEIIQETENDKNLAEGFLSEGEMALLQERYAEGIRAFEAAEQLDSENATLYYRQGLALFEFGTEEGREKALLLANKKFKKAVSLDPSYFEALHAWGNSLTYLGETLEEHHYFVDAKERYEQALCYIKSKSEIVQAELYWDYGIIWYHIGHHSGEAIDHQYALRAFEKAHLLCDGLPVEFWIDYGTTALLLTDMISDSRHIMKAIECFRRAISLQKNHFDAWASLAESLQTLYQHTHDEEHYNQAIDCYNEALKINPQDGELSLGAARFIMQAARGTKSEKKVMQAIEKCQHAYTCDPDDAQALAIWAEGLAFLGEQTEKIDLLYDAQNKIAAALEMDEELPEIWYSYGMCLSSFGGYYGDFDHYYQAIEKFQAALSIDRSFASAWHAIGRTYVTVGMLESDVENILQSLKFFEKALACKNSTLITIDYAMALAKIGEMTHLQEWLEQAAIQFEQVLSAYKNALYLQPDWLYHYGSTLDHLGDFHEEDHYYTRAIEIFTHVLMVDPEYPGVHHRMAQSFCHLGELTGNIDFFYRAIHHLRLALGREEENDHMILDWGIALINVAQKTAQESAEQIYMEAEHKLTLAAKLGNVQAYYHLSCLYSLTGKLEKSLHFLLKADTYKALPLVEDILADDWLEDVRATGEFQAFISTLESRQKATDQ